MMQTTVNKDHRNSEIVRQRNSKIATTEFQDFLHCDIFRIDSEFRAVVFSSEGFFTVPSRSEFLKQKLPRGFKKYEYLRVLGIGIGTD